MKIVVNNLSKSFGNLKLFENFSYTFSENKLYSIVGESGSGKSTFLNILSMLDGEFEGEVLADSVNYSLLKNKDKANFRLSNFGFIFQNFKLFEEDTVKNNIRIVVDALLKEKEEVKIRRINEILDVLGLKELENSLVKNLSGGEKQRVAIARAIVNSPSIIFCDEPTGSLDEENTIKIFEILQKLSTFSTVIIVTHDEENALKYSNVVLRLENYRFKEIYNSCVIKSIKKLPLMMFKNKQKHGKLTFKFINAHFKSLFKTRKVRYLIRNLLISVSLISSGLAVTLTSSLNDSISSSFSSIVSDNEVVLTRNNASNEVLDYYSTSKKDILTLLARYPNDIKRYGVNYLVDFENYFINGNDLFSVNKNVKRKFGGFTARHFNEFVYMDEIDSYEIYPKLSEPLNSEEVVLSISYEQMKEICLEVQILRNFDSLGEYLAKNPYYVSLELANDEWEYSDEQLFRVKGVIFDNVNRVYHTDNVFNEALFEEQMRFPTSNRLNKVEEYPWVFKKVYFIETSSFQNKILNELFYDERYKEYIFDVDSEKYRPLTYEYKTSGNYIYVFNAFKDALDLGVIDTLNSYGFDYENYFFSTNAGYFNSGTNLFTGFNNPTFFSLDENKLDFIIDAYSRVEAEQIYNIKTPENVVDGFALKANSDNVKFKVVNEPLKLQEIVISGGFAEILNEKELLNKEIYSTMLVESEMNGDILKTKFKTIKLQIKDVIKEDKSVAIYQNRDFSISLFRDLFNVSSFRLIPNSIIFSMDEKVDESELRKLNGLLADYSFKNPLLEIENSVEESTKFLRYILYGFSLISIISSLILSSLITMINATEQKNEIELLSILGFENKEIRKMFLIDNFLNSLVCVVSSLAALIFINIFVGKAIGEQIGLEAINVFTPLSILVVIFVAFLIVITSSFAIKTQMIKN